MNFRISRLRSIFLVILILVLGIGFYQLKYGSKQNEFQTYQVSRQNLEELLKVSGNVQPNGRIDVYSSTNGVIQNLFVQNGQYIEAEQPLFSVVSTATPQEVEAARAALLAAQQTTTATLQEKVQVQTQLEQARQQILDAQAAVDNLENDPNANGNYSEAEKQSIYSGLQSARLNFENIEKKYLEFNTKIASVTSQQQAKKVAYQATTDQIIKAVSPGMVSNINFDIGEEVLARVDPKSKSVLSLTDFTKYTVSVTVKETDIYKVQTNQPVKIQLEALPKTEFNGRVLRIDSLGSLDQGVVNYQVEVSLAEADDRIRPGMTAQVELILDQVDNALVVPNNFLIKTDETFQVLVLDGSKTPQARTIKLGLKNAQYTQVEEGLAEGEVVVFNPNLP